MIQNFGLASLDGKLSETWAKMEPPVQDGYSQDNFKTVNNERMVDRMGDTGMKVFENLKFGQVRVIEKDGEPWFANVDICRALAINNPSQALTRLDDDEHFTTLILNEGGASGVSNTAFVNESGLYELVIGSRKKEAQDFRRWIKRDVLPSIRKHGGYMTPATLLNAVKDPTLLITILQALQEEQQQRFVAEQRLQAAQPDIQFSQHTQAMEGSVIMERFSKIIQQRGIRMGRNKLFAWLRGQGYLMKDNQPYQRYSDLYFKSGFVIKSNRFVPYTQITGKGMVHITKKILEERNVALEDVKGYICEINKEIAAVGDVA